jgi:predicted transcriptional regulator
MKIEEQIWNGLCKRIRYAEAKHIAKKLGLNEATVKWYLNKYYKQGLLDMRIRPSNKIKRYRIKL